MVDTTPLVPSVKGDEVKIGHRYCGCCCDSRRAVIIYSIIYLILDLIGLGLAVVVHLNNVWTSDGVTIQSGSAASTAWLAIYGVSIAVRILTLVGAGIYNKWMVGIAALWEIIYVILLIVVGGTKPVAFAWSDGSSFTPVYTYNPAATIILTIILSGLIFYAEVVFVHEVNKGIMSKETYKVREEHSCCCV